MVHECGKLEKNNKLLMWSTSLKLSVGQVLNQISLECLLQRQWPIGNLLYSQQDKSSPEHSTYNTVVINQFYWKTPVCQSKELDVKTVISNANKNWKQHPSIPSPKVYVQCHMFSPYPFQHCKQTNLLVVLQLQTRNVFLYRNKQMAWSHNVHEEKS